MDAEERTRAAVLRKREPVDVQRLRTGRVEPREAVTVGEASAKRWVWQYESWVWQYERDGHLEPKKKGGDRRSDIDPSELEDIVTRLGDANADETTAEYNRGHRGRDRRHVSSIKRELYRAGYVVKKTCPSGEGAWQGAYCGGSLSEAPALGLHGSTRSGCIATANDTVSGASSRDVPRDLAVMAVGPLL